MSVLSVLGVWAWAQTPSPYQIFTGLGLPVAVAFAWARYRSKEPGEAVTEEVRISPKLRLVFELLLFTSAVACLWDIGAMRATYLLTGLSLLHYGLSYDRVIWMLKH